MNIKDIVGIRNVKENATSGTATVVGGSGITNSSNIATVVGGLGVGFDPNGDKGIYSDTKPKKQKPLLIKRIP